MRNRGSPDKREADRSGEIARRPAFREPRALVGTPVRIVFSLMALFSTACGGDFTCADDRTCGGRILQGGGAGGAGAENAGAHNGDTENGGANGGGGAGGGGAEGGSGGAAGSGGSGGGGGQ
jgi:hypothetical protein